jgi:hypothetical protein
MAVVLLHMLKGVISTANEEHITSMQNARSHRRMRLILQRKARLAGCPAGSDAFAGCITRFSKIRTTKNLASYVFVAQALIERLCIRAIRVAHMHKRYERDQSTGALMPRRSVGALASSMPVS